MSRWLAITAHQCQIDGVPTGHLYLGVHYFDLPSKEEVERTIKEAPATQYLNDDDETISWPVVEVLEVEPLAKVASGGELIGYMGVPGEFEALSLRKPGA